jgi:hypothetical protein
MALTLSLFNRNFIYDAFRGRRGLARRKHFPASARRRRDNSRGVTMMVR